MLKKLSCGHHHRTPGVEVAPQHPLLVLLQERLIILVGRLESAIDDELPNRLGHVLKINHPKALALNFHVRLLPVFHRHDMLSHPLRVCSLHQIVQGRRSQEGRPIKFAALQWHERLALVQRGETGSLG